MAKDKIISCLREDIQLMPMLLGGQSFRWTSSKPDNYVGVIKNAVWDLTQSDREIIYKTYSDKPIKNEESILREYLRLGTDLKKLYKSWKAKDEHFKLSSEKYPAIRMLNQDVTENVFSFICSSNNNIKRISSMVEKLCSLYGTKIATVDGKEYFSFPKVSSLAQGHIEGDLRTAGFGYRAKFIYNSAVKINEVGEDVWVKRLQQLEYGEAKKELMQLQGVGAKVADCICLMSLNHLQAIPVDTHVFQIASTHYLKHLKGKKSVTDSIYNEIGNFFRDLFGPEAGWAHTILFCADLKSLDSEPKKRKAPAPEEKLSVSRRKKK